MRSHRGLPKHIVLSGYSPEGGVMSGKRFSIDKIMRILEEGEQGLPIVDVCRQHNCSEPSFYRWKAKFGGMTLAEAKDLLDREHQGGSSDTKAES